MDLATVVGQAVETARPLIDERRHRLTVSLPEGPIRLEADPTRLEQVLWNLLNNAAKYTEPGGRIRLTVEPDGGEVVVRVRDTGIGIGPEMLPRLFEMFVQVGEHRGARPGRAGDRPGPGEDAGRDARRHDRGPQRGAGHAAASSSSGCPSSPMLAELRAPEPGHRRGPATDLPRRRILVVDDNVDAAVSLARLLARLYGRRCGSPTTAPRPWSRPRSSGPRWSCWTSACRAWTATRWPGGCGSGPSSGRTLIVALTGWGQEADRRRSGEAGFDHHLVKPVDPEVLRGLIVGPSPDGGTP